MIGTSHQRPKPPGSKRSIVGQPQTKRSTLQLDSRRLSMLVMKVTLRLMTAAVTLTAICSPTFAAPAASVAGSWRGPFLGTNFTFEFTQTGNGWTGRFHSEKSGKWDDLQNVSYTQRTLRFSFKSQPPSTLTLKVDAAGKALSGTAKIGTFPLLPLTLARVS
jgi:hypothetical protein